MPFAQQHQKVSQSHFAMVPRNDVPRSLFRQRSGHKTTFDAGPLVPVYVNEVLPGDSFRMKFTAFARMQPAIFPIMDNLYLDTFWFFVPNRLVWKNWKYFMGEAPTFGVPVDYTIPVMADATGVGNLGTLADFFGMPSVAQMSVDPNGGTMHNINALPFRAYCLIWDEWFRDENLQGRALHYADWDGDGPDNWDPVGPPYGPNQLKYRNKRHDYFTACLPFPQKGDAATFLTGLAPVIGMGFANRLSFGTTPTNVFETPDATRSYAKWIDSDGSTNPVYMKVEGAGGSEYPAIYADLSKATANTIEAFRQAYTSQLFMEKDARGGTRYTEILRSHFGVISPDFRLQRPEYLGGNSTPIHINPVAQTSETASTPLGQLAGVGTGVHQSGFSQSFTEHGHVFCLANIRADLTYQQGFHRMWSRRTKYDFYWPTFAHLGEQAVLRKEIYCVGDEVGAPAQDFDNLVFGYQERWAEYRYFPSKITGKFRSGITGTLDAWHLAQEFGSPPVLDSAFITENVPMDRILAAGVATEHQEFICDMAFDCNLVRLMPTYSVPGLGGRF